MGRPLSPNSAGQLPLAPLAILGICWAGIAAVGAVWVAGRTAAAVSGHGWNTGPGFGTAFAAGLLHGRWHQLWPDVPLILVAVLSVVFLGAITALLGTGVWMWTRHQAPAGDPLPALAGPGDLPTLTPAGALHRARSLRPSLAGLPAKTIAAEQTGLALGRLHHHRHTRGPILRSSWEDVLLAIMAPRSGKTTALAIPAVLSAPGAVIATSNKADLWAATAALRTSVGAVYVFDPQAITHAEQSWWWNPLIAVRTVEDAHRLSGHFLTAIRDGKNSGADFWSSAAHDLLTALLLAAARADRSLRDVQAWLSDTSTREPARLLAAAGYPQLSLSLQGRQAGAVDTREGVYETARTAAQCLQNPQIMAWVTPPATDLPTLDIASFAAGQDTLYLLSKDGAGAAGPLVAALVDQLLSAGVRAAELAGGRLDPPMVAVLDEAANICKIGDLPELYSHFGSRGITLATILQSYKQGTRVWGDNGMDTLWGAATIKLIGAGIDDARFAEDLSRLIGDHDVPVASHNHTRDGSNESISLRRQRILPPEHIRALPRGNALLLATGAKPAMLELLPWYQGSQAPHITAALAHAQEAMTTHARRNTTPPAGACDE